MSFKDAFITFVNYFIAYSDNYKMLTSNIWGAYKRNPKNDYPTLILGNNKVDISKANFLTSIRNLIVYFNENIFNISPFVFPNFVIFISHITDNELIDQICNIDAKVFFSYQEISDINLVLDNYNKRITKPARNPVQNQDEIINTLQEQVRTLLAKEANSNSISASTDKSLPSDFSDAFRLFQIQYEKKAKNENHIKLFETHLQNTTVPPSLLWNRFPVPFLPQDQAFVDDYNKLISAFQCDALALNIKHCKKRISANNETLGKYKNFYNNVDDLGNKLDKIKTDTEKKLKNHFLELDEKISRYRTQRLPLAPPSNKPDASFNNQYNNEKRASNSANNSANNSYNAQNNSRAKRYRPSSSNRSNNSNNFRGRNYNNNNGNNNSSNNNHNSSNNNSTNANYFNANGNHNTYGNHNSRRNNNNQRQNNSTNNVTQSVNFQTDQSYNEND